MEWRKLLIEGALIVISILLAFAIDAAWEHRKDVAEEREILVGLELEFEDLRGRLEIWRDWNNRSAGLIERFLSDDVQSMSASEIEEALTLSFLANVLDQGGPLDALLASGRLEMISDEEIRRRLAKWPDWLEDIHTNDLSIRGVAFHEIAPLLARNGYPDFVCSGQDFLCAPGGDAPEEWLALAAIPELRSLLSYRHMFARMSASDHENARQEAIELLELLRARIADIDGAG